MSTTNEIPRTGDWAAADATLLGEEARARTGWSLADVGDVDGNGQVDVLIGAPHVDESAGAAYLVTGAVTGTMDLSDADTRFVGAAARDRAGVSIAGAGDVDADGYDDVIIGATGSDGRFSPMARRTSCSVDGKLRLVRSRRIRHLRGGNGERRRGLQRVECRRHGRRRTAGPGGGRSRRVQAGGRRFF